MLGDQCHIYESSTMIMNLGNNEKTFFATLQQLEIDNVNIDYIIKLFFENTV